MQVCARILSLCLLAGCSLDTSPLGLTAAGRADESARTWMPASLHSAAGTADAGALVDASTPTQTASAPDAHSATAPTMPLDAGAPTPPAAGSTSTGLPPMAAHDAGVPDASADQDAMAPPAPGDPAPGADKTRVPVKLVNAVIAVLSSDKQPDKSQFQSWRKAARSSDAVTADLATELLVALAQSDSCSAAKSSCGGVCQALAQDCSACASAASCQALLTQTCGAALAKSCRK